MSRCCQARTPAMTTTNNATLIAIPRHFEVRGLLLISFVILLMFPKFMTHTYPHPQSLVELLAMRLGSPKTAAKSPVISRRERDAKPFSLGEKGGDEGNKVEREDCHLYLESSINGCQ